MLTWLFPCVDSCGVWCVGRETEGEAAGVRGDRRELWPSGMPGQLYIFRGPAQCGTV